MSTTTETDSTPLRVQLREASKRLSPDRMQADRFLSGLYSSALELAERRLEAGADPAWTAHVLQEQVPLLRESAGIDLDGDSPYAERERELRESFDVPAP